MNDGYHSSGQIVCYSNGVLNEDQKSVTQMPGSTKSVRYSYRDKICLYDEHPISGRDIQYRAPVSRSRYTTQFNIL